MAAHSLLRSLQKSSRKLGERGRGTLPALFTLWTLPNYNSRDASRSQSLQRGGFRFRPARLRTGCGLTGSTRLVRCASRLRAGAEAGRRGGGGGRGGASTVPTRYRGGGGGGSSERPPPSAPSPSPLPEALLPEAPEPRGEAAANSGEGLWFERGFPGSADCPGRKEVRAEGQVSPARAGSARLAGSERGRNSDLRPRAWCGARAAAGEGGGRAGAALHAAAVAGARCPVPAAGQSPKPLALSLFDFRAGTPAMAGDWNPPAPTLSWCRLPLLGISLAGLLRMACAQRDFSNHWDGKVALTFP